VTAPGFDAAELAARVKAGDRRALARAITLVESSRADDAPRRRALLREISPIPREGFTLAVTGVPGAGKSTLIDVYGRRLLAAGHRVAILTVDPSSARSGGSVLGDKTRMGELVKDPRAFVRPSPSSGAYGGAAPRTREALMLCRAAAFERIVLETVGVGQSERDAALVADVVVYVTLAGAGDDLQGLKRGALEHADVIVFNKADGEARARVESDASRFAAAFALLRPDAPPRVLTTSAADGTGVGALLDEIERRAGELESSGRLDRLRARQAEAWFDAELDREVLRRFHGDARVAARVPALKAAIARGAQLPSEAVEDLLDELEPGPRE
jgi:LAO/AO transport system kinase